MKSYPIKKRQRRNPIFIQEIRPPLPKPKLPLIVLFKIHKPEVYVEFIYR